MPDRLGTLLATYAERLKALEDAKGVTAPRFEGGAAALLRYYERRALLALMHRMEWHPGEPYEVAAHRMLEDLPRA